jgi:hypothetical protein
MVAVIEADAHSRFAPRAASISVSSSFTLRAAGFSTSTCLPVVQSSNRHRRQSFVGSSRQ